MHTPHWTGALAVVPITAFALAANLTLESRPARITVNGDLEDWRDVPFQVVTPDSGVLDPAARPPDSAADLSFRFAVAHDTNALYVAVEVTDDVTASDSCPPGTISAPAWDDDAVEVFIDGDHDGAPNSRVPDGSELRFGGEFSLIVNGAAMSDYSGYPKTFGTVWTGAVDAGRRTYEIRLPWAVMGLTARPSAIGFTISVQDDDDGGRRDHALYWTGTLPSPFLDESGFGTVRFVEP